MPRVDAKAEITLDSAGIEAVSDMIANGVTYRDIAAMYGIGLGRLCAWIEADAERSHACARAREVSGQAYDEMASQIISDAKDPFDLAKAKELAVHWRWRAKAVNPRRYSDKVQVGGSEDMPPVRVDGKLTISPDEAYKRMIAGD